ALVPRLSNVTASIFRHGHASDERRKGIFIRMLKRPCRDVQSVVIGLLEVSCPATPGQAPLDQDSQTRRNFGLVGRDAGSKLGHKPRMIELTGPFILKIRATRAHPERIAMQ